MSKNIPDRLVNLAFDFCAARWERSSTAFLAATTVAAIVAWRIFDTNTLSQLPFIWTIPVGAFAATLVAWYASSRPPTVPKKMVGVVIAVACETDEDYRQLRSDFLGEVRSLFSRGSTATTFHLIIAPRRHANYLHDDRAADAYLSRTRGHILIYGRIREREMQQGALGRFLSLDGGVVHRCADPEIRKELVTDFSEVLPRRVIVPNAGSVLHFEVASQWLDIATRHVVGFAAMVSGDVALAERLFLEVEERLPPLSSRVQHAPLRRVARRVPERLELLYRSWLHSLYQEYFRTRDLERLQEAERVCDCLLQRAPDDYAAHLVKAICEIALRRNSSAARKHINRCKSVKDAGWLYSAAFLDGYDGKLDRAAKKYEKAFGMVCPDDTVLVQCEEFIQAVLEREPHRFPLHFCSGLINLYGKKDYEGAAKDFAEFLGRCNNAVYPKERKFAQDILVRSQSLRSPSDLAA